jgi:hypothetical protein
MGRWIIVVLIFALAYIGCETADQQRAKHAAELIREQSQAVSDDGKDATGIKVIGLTVSEDTYDEMVYVYPATRQEQIKLMGECIEDAKDVHLDKGMFVSSNLVRAEQVRIAVAFFNYRIGEK